jgi:hypothetical protein
LILLTGSYAISMLIGLSPLQALDVNAFSNYYSHYNGLRMAKGFGEAVLLFFLLPRQLKQQNQIADHLVTGMVLGLASVVLLVLWERFRFSGLFDFNSDFRVVANFSGLHNGGDDPEAYLVLAQPFLFAWAMLRKNMSAWLVVVVLFATSTYAMLVTYSRAGYLGFMVSWTILCFCLVLRRTSGKSLRTLIFVVIILATAAIIVIPAFKGTYIPSRFNTLSKDMNYRLTQSQNSVRMMNPDWITTLFGMGLGRYPEMFYLRRPLQITPAIYKFEREGGNTFLRLSPGSPLYFEQRVATTPYSSYSLSLKVRGVQRTTLSVVICEKNLLYSFGCAAPIRVSVETNGDWKRISDTINTGMTGVTRLGWLSRRPIKLTLYNTGRHPVDVDDVSLTNSRGENIVANGDFSFGIDHWFFATDEHLAWQIKNHWVHLYFEQGLTGVVAHFLLCTLVLAGLFSKAVNGDGLAGPAFASIVGFCAVGLFGFLFDTPRIAMLFFLITFSTYHIDKSPS